MKQITVFLIALLIAKLSYSQNWQKLDNGVDQEIWAMYNDTTDDLLYIGGRFRVTKTDSLRISAVASWNGNNFAPVGCGFDWNCTSTYISPGSYPGQPICFIRYKGLLYSGGFFNKADNKPIGGLAKWDGITWDSVIPGKNFANSFLIFNNELYMSGGFLRDSLNNAQILLKWDGINYTIIQTDLYNWTITAMAEYKNELYFGGGWDSAGNNKIIKKWDGQNWEDVGTGIAGGMSHINKLIVYKGELYAAGAFKKSDGNPGNNIAKWDGNKWSDVGNGCFAYYNYGGQIYDMIVYHDELYAAGVFDVAGNVWAYNIAKWDGEKWCSLGSYIDNAVTDLAVYHDMLYIGGGFWTIDNDSVFYIAKWTGGDYEAICSTYSGEEEMNLEEGIRIYPNPANSVLSVELGFMSKGGLCRVYDIPGATVIEKTFTGNKININVCNLPKGLYLVRVEDDKVMAIKKFIKE